MEFLKAILEAAQEEEAPVFLQTSENALRYAGIDYLAGMVKEVEKKYSIPFALHLDHGKSLDAVKLALRYGYTSVMIDLSDRPFSENLSITKEVVSLCAPLGVAVEAELGRVGEGKKEECPLVEPLQAKEFVEQTGVDALAPAIGTAHGIFKFKGEHAIDYQRLKEVKRLTGVALVLHGASGVYEELVEEVNRLGGELTKTKGLPDEEVKKAIELGVNKVNTDIDLRLAWTAGLREALEKKRKTVDPREFLRPATERVKEMVKRRIRLYGSSGKAHLLREGF